MTESTSRLSRTEFFDRIGNFKGWPSDQTKWSTEQTRQAQRILDDAYSRVILAEVPNVEGGSSIAHQWSFLTSEATITTVSGQNYNDLPDDFEEEIGRSVLYGASQPYLRAILIDQAQLREKRQRFTSNSYPMFGCILPVSPTSSRGQRWRIHWCPTPDAAYTLYLPYRIQVNALSASNPYPLGGTKLGILIRQACLAEADGEGGQESAKYLRMLQAAIAADQRKQKHFHIGGPEGGIINHLTEACYQESSWDRW